MTGFGLLFIAGARRRHLAVLAGIGVLAVVVRLLQVPYERKRLVDFVDFMVHGKGDRLDAGYQLDQSLIALGSGGFIGRGIGAGLQKFRFLPDSHTDFIYAIIGEEGGFLAAVLVLGVYAVVIWRALSIAAAAEDRFSALTAAGIGVMLAVHVLLNVAVVTGLVPTTGLPLPFLSYGGSSLVVNLAAVGILLRLAADRSRLASARF
jgi:cell division protein FtsW